MTTETIRLLFSYAIAAFLIGAGLTFLYLAMDKPSATSTGLIALVAGFVGSAITFVFNGAAASQATKSYAAGVSTTPSQVPPQEGP